MKTSAIPTSFVSLLPAVLLSVSFLGCPPVGAQLITHEGFNYSSGSVDGQTGGSGWGGGWDNQDDNANYEIESGTPMAFGSLVTSGNYLNGGGSYQNTGRRLATSFGSGWDSAGRVSDPFGAGTGQQTIDQGTVWSSMLVRLNAPITSWDNARIFFHRNSIPWFPNGFADNDGLQIRLNGGDSSWSVSEGQSGPSISTGVGASVGTTYLFVIKFELSLAAGANNAYVWIFDNPSSVTLGGADLLTSSAHASITGRDNADLRFHSLGFYLDNANDRLSVDELRLGVSFADVTPIPEPSTFALLAAGGAALLWACRRKAA